MAQPKFPVRRLLSRVVTWFGRLGIPNTTQGIVGTTRPTPRGTAPTSCRTTTTGDSVQLWNMFLTSPYIFAGVRFRDVSRLWTGADMQKDEHGVITAPAQVVSTNPDTPESEQLTFCRWLLDYRLQTDMKQILEQASYPKQIFGKAVMEILWTKETQGEYAGKLVIDDLIDVDPTLFVFNPPKYEPGFYLRKPTGTGSVSYDYERLDERRFLVITNHLLFSDQNGISELETLRQTEPRREDNERNWGRANQRSGRGTLIGSYGPSLLGAEAEAEREEFQTALEKFDADNNTVMIKYEENAVEVLSAGIESGSFKDFSTEEKEQISLVLTGSPTTLKEGQFGNQSMIESSEVRQESNLEKGDCADISAAFTHQILRRACDFNWIETPDYPKMQIISANMYAPTTPEEQQTNQELIGRKKESGEPEAEDEPLDTEAAEVDEEIVKESRIDKFQEEEDAPTVTPPVAIPVGYKDFPNTEPLSETVKGVLDFAREALADMPVKEYSEVQPNDAPFVFTVKRLRGWSGDVTDILTKLKMEIALTLDAKSEADAWTAYYARAVAILKDSGVDMTPAIRDDLNISFRQARQNVFSEAVYRQAASDPAIVGLRIVNRPSDNHHTIHTFWDGVAIRKDHPELQRGGRLRVPMDFGCICEYEYVKDKAALTPESEWPQAYPGQTYKYYAQPDDRRSEAQ